MSNHYVTEVTKRVDYEVAAPGGEYAIELTLYNEDDDIDIRDSAGGHLAIWACDIDALIAGLTATRARWVAEYGEPALAELGVRALNQKAQPPA